MRQKQTLSNSSYYPHVFRSSRMRWEETSVFNNYHHTDGKKSGHRQVKVFPSTTATKRSASTVWSHDKNETHRQEQRGTFCDVGQCCCCLGTIFILVLVGILVLVLALVLTQPNSMSKVTVSTTDATTGTDSTSPSSLTSSSGSGINSTTSSSTSSSGSGINSTTSLTTSTSTTSITTATSTTSTTTTTQTTAVCGSGSGLGNTLALAGSNPSSWTQFQFNFTATSTQHFIMFGFQNENNRQYYLDEVSVTNINTPGVELLNNPSFETSTASIPGWTISCSSTCSGFIATIEVGSNCYLGTGNCLKSKCYASSGIEFVGQSFPTTVGNIYSISFRLILSGSGATIAQRFFFDII